MKTGKKLKLLCSIAWKSDPFYFPVLFFNTFLTGAQVFANVILPKFLIDELTGLRRIPALFVFGSLIVGANLFFYWAARLLKRCMDVKNQNMSQKMNEALGEKILKLEYAKLEDPYYLDLKERATFVIANQSALYSIVNGVAEVLRNGVTVVGLLAILFTLSPLLVLIILVLVGLMLLIQRRFSLYQQKYFEGIIPVNRRYGYYVNLSFNNEMQKDIRLYDMAGMIGGRITEYNEQITDEFRVFYRRQGFYMGLYSIINDLQAAVAYVYVGLRVLGSFRGTPIGLGSFTMYVNAAIQFSTNITGFGQSVIMFREFMNYLEPFMELMGLPEEQEQKGGIPFQGPVRTIAFEHVDFTYPGSEKKVLQDISFTVAQGEKISVVGLNGAGKTTLIKLLCRFYRPDSGRILVNGQDIFAYDHSSYMKEVAAVFQDYRLFAFSIEENISGCAKGQQSRKVEQLIRQVGLEEKMKELPLGMQTLLGKAYDESGTELSGGQNQKIAIARALYKDASLIILDEPTSALDPLAEAEIYENFNRLAGGRTAFYISHRMSSSVFCDRILVIDGGRISDYASHQQLMQKTDSLYYKLFMSQAENYAG